MLSATIDRELCCALGAAHAVLFDLFRTLTGVVVTNDPLPPEPGEMLGFVKEPLATAWQQAWSAVASDRLLGGIRSPREVLALPARRVDADIADTIIDAAVASRQLKFDNALLLIAPEVLATLHALRRAGKKLALTSNADCMEVAAWPRSPLCERFDVALFSCHLGIAKPEPGIFLAACEALGVAPSECLYVGDGGSDELCAASELGMVPIQMTGILERHFPGLAERQGLGARFRIKRIAALAECLGD